MDAALNEQMIEFRAASVRAVSLVKIADIVMKRLKCEAIMGILDLDELEILSDAIKTERAELLIQSLEDIRNEHILTTTNVMDTVALATASATNSIMKVTEESRPWLSIAGRGAEET